jgi:hypothetical protein
MFMAFSYGFLLSQARPSSGQASAASRAFRCREPLHLAVSGVDPMTKTTNEGLEEPQKKPKVPEGLTDIRRQTPATLTKSRRWTT